MVKRDDFLCLNCKHAIHDDALHGVTLEVGGVRVAIKCSASEDVMCSYWDEERPIAFDEVPARCPYLLEHLVKDT